MSWSNQSSAPVFALKIQEIHSALPEAKHNSRGSLPSFCSRIDKGIP
jgi:hypothetical protein